MCSKLSVDLHAEIISVTAQCLDLQFSGLPNSPNNKKRQGDVISILYRAGKTPSSASAYQVLLTAFPAMHASAYRLLRLLASVCKGALTPLYAGLIAIASSSLQRVASEGSGSFASGSLCSVRSEVCSHKLHALGILSCLHWTCGMTCHAKHQHGVTFLAWIIWRAKHLKSSYV